MASLATKHPQLDSTLSGWITSNPPISGKEATMEIVTTGHPTQIIILCKHVTQLPLFTGVDMYIYT